MTPTGPTAAPASMLGRYRLIREIARSNDIVWEGIDPQVNRRVAVKELALDPTLSGQARRHRIERFYREARAAGAMNHPNIVTIYEVGEDRGRYYIAMEFLEGQTLRERLSLGGALSVSEAVDITSALCDALSYAHSRGIIHRDIKPDNIFLIRSAPDANGVVETRVKLADFGIARITTEAQLTVAGQVFGTPSYMSPEQVLGQEIDARSDIFSLGIVLYEMVTGRKPFIGDSVVTITYQIVNAPTPNVLGAPPFLDQVIQRATGKHPSERFNSVGEFRAALAAAGLRHSPTMQPGSNVLTQGYPIPSASGPMPSAPQPTSAYGTATQYGLGGAVGVAPPGPQQVQPMGGWSPTAAPPTANGYPSAYPPPPLPMPEQSEPRNVGALIGAVVFAGLILLGAGWAFTSALAGFKNQTGALAASGDRDKAAKLYQGHKYEDAAKLFLKLGDNEKAGWCYRALGAAAFEAKDYDKATDWFTLAAQVNPADTEAQKNKVQAQKAAAIVKTGSSDPADDPSQRVATPPPTIPVAQTKPVAPFGGASQNDFLRANQDKENRAQGFLNQGNALFGQGNVQDACAAWNDARMVGSAGASVEAGNLYQQHCNGANIPAFGNGVTR